MKNLFLSALLAVVLVTPAFSGQVSIMAENDVTVHTDHYFTHGTRIQYTGDDNLGYSIGQNMYTPDDKEATELVPDDRPYAGYLYGSVFNTWDLDDESEVFVEGQLGVVGPSSYAEQTQKFIHEITGSYVPQGWDNQIPNHVTALVIGRYTYHIWENRYFAVDPFAGAQVGNLAGCLSGGFNVYAGYNLPKTRNQNRVIPFKAVRGAKASWSPYAYAYAGIEPKVMLYNMLLDDPRFTIHPNSSVYDRNLGFVVGCRHFELAFTFCLRSKEFEEQPEPERFGAAKISVNF